MSMEVFIAFDGNMDGVPFLEQSLYGWKKVRFANPICVEVKPGPKFEIQRRVIAENVAKGDWYLLADIDAKPEEPWVISQIQKLIPTRKTCGMAFIRPSFAFGGKVRVVRKGVIKKWPQQETDSYDLEHGLAIVQAGYTMEEWNDIWYRHLPKDNPLLVN